MDNNPRHNTIGILYPGEMGSSFGKLLLEGGFEVLTTVEGRSLRTRGLSRQAGLSVVESLDQLLRRSDVVISLVSPAAAVSVAMDVAARIKQSARRSIYIDANSISPMTVQRVSEVLQDLPVDFVDASIFGLASQLQQRGTLYLSGPRSSELAAQFGPLLHVRAVGDISGQASALKMIISGIPKGLSALLIETMLFAHEMNLLDEALQACGQIYPSIMEVVNRMLPTYPQHAARRSEELREVEQTMWMSGVTPQIVSAVREVTSALANIDWDHYHEHGTVADIIRQIHNEGPLKASESYFEQSPEQKDPRGLADQPNPTGHPSAE